MGYLELGIIFVGSIGAALLLGTGAALWRYLRTGAFPGQPADAGPEEAAAAIRSAKTRMLLGGALTAAGAVTLVAVLT